MLISQSLSGFPTLSIFRLMLCSMGGEDYPGGGAGESAGCALLLNIYAQIVDDITWLGGGDYILFDNMAIIQENDYISTYNCNLMIIG